MERVKKINLNLKKGFSIGEVMLSVFILLVALVGAMQLITASIRESIGSRDYIIASELVQEGVEIARNVRDNNWTVATPSFNGFFPADKTNCRVDKNSLIVQNCNDAANSKKLYYFNGYYVHNAAGSPTKFQRKIMLDHDAANNILTVYSVVAWGGFMPADWTALNACTVNSRCVYAQLILTKWGE